MEFAYTTREPRSSRGKLLAFMDEHVYPAEQVFAEQVAAAEAAAGSGSARRSSTSSGARRAASGLWNLFLPAARHGGAGPDQPAVRPAGRDHRPQPGARARGASTAPRRTPATWRCWPSSAAARAAGALAQAVAGRRDPVRVLHDRAGRGLLRRDQHRHQHRARRRRVRDQRPQVVVVRARWTPRCEIFIVMGKTDPDRRPAPAAEHDPGAPGHPGRRRSSAGMRVFGYADSTARRARRDRVHRRPGAGGEPHRRRGRRASRSPRPGSGPAGSTTACG